MVLNPSLTPVLLLLESQTCLYTRHNQWMFLVNLIRFLIKSLLLASRALREQWQRMSTVCSSWSAFSFSVPSALPSDYCHLHIPFPPCFGGMGDVLQKIIKNKKIRETDTPPRSHGIGWCGHSEEDPETLEKRHLGWTEQKQFLLVTQINEDCHLLGEEELAFYSTAFPQLSRKHSRLCVSLVPDCSFRQ